MNIIRTNHPPVFTGTPDLGGLVENKGVLPQSGGMDGTALTVTESAEAGVCGGAANVTDEVEKSLVRDDWLGRAVNRFFCYNTPAMPEFHD